MGSLRTDPAILLEVQTLLHHEGALLDQRRFAEWLALYTDDAVYWIPRQRGQESPRTTPSIVYDDRALMAMRVTRLNHPRVYSAMPTPHTVHVVGSVSIASEDEALGEYRVTSSQIVVEAKDVSQRVYAGSCEHLLRRHNGALKIAAKRIDLVDCDTIKDVMVVIL